VHAFSGSFGVLDEEPNGYTSNQFQSGLADATNTFQDSKFCSSCSIWVFQ
jgi:hypothetical protein